MEPMAVPALGAPEQAAGELERAIDTWGCRALMIPSSAGGRRLDDPIFAPLFSLIEKHGLLVFHASDLGLPQRPLRQYGMNVLLSWPLETTLAVARLLFAGVCERHPELKLILAHDGGNLVFLRGRIDSAYEAARWEVNPYYQERITKAPTQYLDQLYYATCTLSPASTRFLLVTMDSDRVLFGSDYPLMSATRKARCRRSRNFPPIRGRSCARMRASSSRRGSGDDRDCVDLYERMLADQLGHLYHRRCRRFDRKKLAPHLVDVLEAAHVLRIDVDPHDVGKRTADAFHGDLELLTDTAGLRPHVSYADRIAVLVDRDEAGQKDELSRPGLDHGTPYADRFGDSGGIGAFDGAHEVPPG
jgi:predicted TIM-barrel fold metal-dependent hydrolase